MKIHPVRVEFFHTVGRTDMTKLTVAFRSFANARKDDWEVETVVTPWLTMQDTDSYQQGVEKLLPRYDRYLISGGDALVK